MSTEMKDETNLPVFDFETHGDDLGAASEELVRHLSSVGFVYLRNHRIDDGVIDRCRDAVNRFFGRDREFKETFDMEDYLGYKPYETERSDPTRPYNDAREILGFDAHRRAFDPRWPDDLRDSVQPLIDAAGEVCRRVLKMIGVGLEMENPDIFRDGHLFLKDDPTSTGSFSTFRANHYPLVKGGMKEGQARCGEHVDFGSLTLLFHDSVPGLEVQTSSGDFVPAPPTGSDALLNVGALLEHWTGGRLHAARHRVVVPIESDRTTMALFLHPDHEIDVTPVAVKAVAAKEAMTARKFCRTLIDRLYGMKPS